MTDQQTKEKLQVALLALVAISEAIRALGSIPSGHLYAILMGQMDLPAFESAIRTLKNTGLIVEENYRLVWRGPQ